MHVAKGHMAHGHLRTQQGNWIWKGGRVKRNNELNGLSKFESAAFTKVYEAVQNLRSCTKFRAWNRYILNSTDTTDTRVWQIQLQYRYMAQLGPTDTTDTDMLEKFLVLDRYRYTWIDLENFRKKLATQRCFLLFLPIWCLPFWCLPSPQAQLQICLHGAILAWRDTADTDTCVIFWGNRHD